MELVYSSLRAVDNVIVGWSHDGVPICLRSQRLGDRGIYNWSIEEHPTFILSVCPTLNMPSSCKDIRMSSS